MEQKMIKMIVVGEYTYRIFTKKFTNLLYKKAGTAGNLEKYAVFYGDYFVGPNHEYSCSEPIWMDEQKAHDLCYRV